MNKEDRTPRYLNLDLLRIFCCFLIVLLHFSSSYWYSVDIYSRYFSVMTIYNSLTRISVPIFIMLSGYFLLNPNKVITVKKYISRPVRFLLTVYLWSAFYAFQGAAIDFIKTGTVSSGRLNESVGRFIHGHYHMWFCFLLAGYYILLPIARKIAEDLCVLNWFIVLWVIFAFIAPCAFTWLNKPDILLYFDKFELNLIRGYFGYFFLGYYINRINIVKPIRILIYFCGILSIAATAYLALSQTRASGERIETWFNPGSPFVLVASFAVFLFFNSLDVNCSDRVSKIILSTSKLCFFTYMFHVFILEKMNLIGLTTISFNPIISIPALTIFAFILSFFIAWIVSKIPFINKLLLYNQ